MTLLAVRLRILLPGGLTLNILRGDKQLSPVQPSAPGLERRLRRISDFACPNLIE